MELAGDEGGGGLDSGAFLHGQRGQSGGALYDFLVPKQREKWREWGPEHGVLRR
jgi:hypothetical protein